VVLDNLSSGQRWLVPEDVPLFIGDIGDAACAGDHRHASDRRNHSFRRLNRGA
jgi:hypothetical protein